jgi:hypothetical protein
MQGKGTLIHCWYECKLVQPLWKLVQRLLKKLKIDLPYDCAIPPLGMYSNQYTREIPACPCLLEFTVVQLKNHPRFAIDE